MKNGNRISWLSSFLLTVCLFLSTPVALQAAPGDLDTTFGVGGKVVGSASGSIQDIDIQADGKLVVAGFVAGFTYSNIYDFALARYNPDGSLDKTFGTDGKVITNFAFDDKGFALAIQKDGKIVVAGIAFAVSINTFGRTDFALARYNPDGTLDNTFGTGGKVSTSVGTGLNEAYAVAIQTDGKIVVAGYAQPLGIASPDFALIRYNTDGSLDTTFGTGGIVTTNINGDAKAWALDIQADGKIVAAGHGSYQDFALARYNPDGTLDNTFGNNGTVTTDFTGAYDVVYAIVLQLDGKIVVAGDTYSGGRDYFALARYNPGGSLDTTFGTGGKVTTDVLGYNIDLRISKGTILYLIHGKSEA